VDDALLRRVHDLAKFGPTSANMCPMRIVFVKSRSAKEKLKPALDPGNVDKTMKAPVTAIIAMDVHFYEQLPKLFPHVDAKAWFKDLPQSGAVRGRAGASGNGPRAGTGCRSVSGPESVRRRKLARRATTYFMRSRKLQSRKEVPTLMAILSQLYQLT